MGKKKTEVESPDLVEHPSFDDLLIPSEPEPEHADHTWSEMAAEMAAPVFAHQLLVIGSFEWSNNGAVVEALSQWEMDHVTDGEGISVFTSGCPQGAEAAAVTAFGNRHNWNFGTIRDESILQLRDMVVFAFIKDESEGATAAVELAKQAGLWVRVFREDTHRVVSPWASR